MSNASDVDYSPAHGKPTLIGISEPVQAAVATPEMVHAAVGIASSDAQDSRQHATKRAISAQDQVTIYWDSSCGACCTLHLSNLFQCEGCGAMIQKSPENLPVEVDMPGSGWYLCTVHKGQRDSYVRGGKLGWSGEHYAYAHLCEGKVAPAKNKKPLTGCCSSTYIPHANEELACSYCTSVFTMSGARQQESMIDGKPTCNNCCRERRGSRAAADNVKRRRLGVLPYEADSGAAKSDDVAMER